MYKIGGGIRKQMSREERLIQVAILSDDKKISGVLKKFSEDCCRTKGTPCRCTVFSDLDSFSAALYPEMYTVVFSVCAGRTETLVLLRKIVPRASIILVSEDVSAAMSGYMIEASGVLSVPVGYDQFVCAFERACCRDRKENGKSLLIKEGGEYYRVYTKDLKFVEVSDHYLIYHLFDGTLTMRGQLCGVEKGLEQAGFYRCSAKYMVNLRYIECLSRNSVRIDSVEIPVSRHKKKEFYGRLSGRSRRKVSESEGAPLS